MKYKINEINHPDWLNKHHCYNTAICSRLHGSLFEYFITHARNDRYNLLCYIVTHDKKQPAYDYDESSIGDRLITKHVTTEALEALVATFNFIDIWLKLLDYNYDARHVEYITDMKEMFKQIPTIMTKPLIQRQKVQKLMTEIGGVWYMKKITKVLPPLRIPKLGKKEQDKKDGIKKLYEANRY